MNVCSNCINLLCASGRQFGVGSRKRRPCVCKQCSKTYGKSKTFVRILFIDLSSAFNTIQPHIMVEKLLSLLVNKNLIAWIFDFLINRTQYVKLNETISNLCKLNTGAPQGCVLSPTLYTLYTNDYCVKHSDTSLIKFADDSAFQGLFTNGLDSNYIEEVYRFVKWCEENYLILNVSITKEMILDFRRQKKKKNPTPLVINNETVEIVHTYKYFGFTVDDKLNWHEHCNELIKKINKRMYFLRKLQSFRLNNEVLYTFYCSILGSVNTFGISCRDSSITARDRKRLNSTIKKAGKIMNRQVPNTCIETLFSYRLP